MRMAGALFLSSPSRACSGLQSPVQAAKPVSFPLISKSVMAELPEESGKAARETMKRYSSTNLKRSGKGVSIMWFRNDLRILDNEALYRAWQSSEALLPVYCIDPRLFGTTHYFGFPKTGELRAQFLLECLADLRKNLQLKGLELVIKHGKPESILPSIAREVGAHTVYAQKETCDEELRVEKHVMKALNNVHQLPHSSAGELENRRINLELIWGTTMYHIDDLPFIPSRIPDVYTQFRKAVESSAAVKQCLRLPLYLGPLPERIEEKIGSFEAIPSMAELGHTFGGQNGLGTMKFIGGESVALVRVNEYFWLKDMLRVYKETRNGMLGADYSSKFSPWLAFGCLSARLIHEEVKRYENERSANDSTYWMLFELIWRDYFRFLSIKYGNAIFHIGGPRHVKGKVWSQDLALFETWKNGCTGYPLIDANMRELNATGFMSNRGRQIVCSFLVRDMGIDWRLGAEWFETCLLDYDPCSNYGNWTYGAGVGNDPREDRYFSIPKQAQTYDPEGEYVSYWIPELSKLPPKARHFPGSCYIKPTVPLKFGDQSRATKPGSFKKANTKGRGLYS